MLIHPRDESSRNSEHLFYRHYLIGRQVMFYCCGYQKYDMRGKKNDMRGKKKEKKTLKNMYSLYIKVSS